MPSIPDLPASTTLEGQSILITGANVGLGYAAALLALQHGASPLYIAVRTTAKGNATRDALLADPIVKKKNPDAVVKIYELEMTEWKSVTDFADKFIADRKLAGEGLDIAILNAGIVNLEFETAPTGNEKVLQVNHYSTALLSLLLLPLLESSTTPQHTARLTIVSSGTHLSAPLKHYPPENINYLESLNTKESFGGGISGSSDRYGLSKLLIIMFLRELASKVSSEKVIINNVCPGMIKTELTRGAPWWAKPVVFFMQLRANPVEKGGMCYIDAVANRGKESHGLWYQYSQPAKYSEFVTGPEGPKTQKRIWDETIQALDKVVPGVGSNL